jgi:hypothetical protein
MDSCRISLRWICGWRTKEKEMDKKMFVLFVKAIGAIGGIASFVWLFMYDWKLAIAVFFILWGNNVSTKDI